MPAKPSNPFLKKATGGSKSPVAQDGRKRHGLGRGLDSLIPSSAKAVAAASAFDKAPLAAPAAAAQPGVPLELNILEIERSPFQPRRDFKETELMELADSLKNNGQIGRAHV